MSSDDQKEFSLDPDELADLHGKWMGENPLIAEICAKLADFAPHVWGYGARPTQEESRSALREAIRSGAVTLNEAKLVDAAIAVAYERLPGKIRL